MIAQLSGVIVSQRPPWLVLDVNGVAYELEMPLSAFYDLPSGKLRLYTHLLVREDAQLLYGFTGEAERDSFRLLLKVSGVGGKVALACLSALPADELQLAIQQENVARLSKIPGIGRKTAERMILELRGKVGHSGKAVLSSAVAAPRDEALAALLSLGYKPTEANTALQKLAPDLNTEQYIRQALQVLTK